MNFYRLRWSRHLLRIPNNRIPRWEMVVDVEGWKEKLGRPNQDMESVHEDIDYWTG